MQMWGIRKEKMLGKKTVLEAFVARNHTPETQNVHVHVFLFFFNSQMGIKIHSFACACACVST